MLAKDSLLTKAYSISPNPEFVKYYFYSKPAVCNLYSTEATSERVAGKFAFNTAPVVNKE